MNSMMRTAERIRGVHTYLNEALSHLIISVKLTLYGALVEALTIRRNALERMACMALMVENKKLKQPLNRTILAFQKNRSTNGD